MEQFNDQQQDLGVVLYESSNAKSIYDAPSGKIGAKGWAQRIYMILLAVAMLAWFVYGLVNAANDPELGFTLALVSHLGSLFVLFVGELILFLTAFGGWGKFVRIAVKHPSLTRKRGAEGMRTREMIAELQQADANKAVEDAVRIYEQFVEVVNEGERLVLSLAEIQQVRCDETSAGCQLTFFKYDGSSVIANQLLPAADLPVIKKYIDRLDCTTSQRRQPGYWKKKLPTLMLMTLPILIGIALIVVQRFVLRDMPIVFGIMFLAIGSLLMIAQFNDVAIVKHGIFPIGGGLVLMALPIGILLTLVQLIEGFTYEVFFTTFTELHAIFGLFVGFGPILIIAGIGGIADCVRA